MRRLSPTRLVRSRGTLCLAMAVSLGNFIAVPACDVQILPNPPADPNGGNDDPDPDIDPLVTLQLVNLTDVAVDAQIYISTNGEATTPDVLFVDEFRFTAGVGLAATGVLIPRTVDLVEFACDEVLVIGTAGGIFQDAETGEELGAGTPRLVEKGLVFDCGAIVTFAYREVDEGFTVDVGLEPGDDPPPNE